MNMLMLLLQKKRKPLENFGHCTIDRSSVATTQRSNATSFAERVELITPMKSLQVTQNSTHNGS